MGILDALGLIGGPSGAHALAAALLFCLGATVRAARWARRFGRGPVEELMRRFAG